MEQSADPVEKMNERNPLLAYVVEVCKDKNKNTTYRCLSCDFQFTGSITKVESHFLRKSIGTVGVQACRNPPKDAVVIAAKRFKVFEETKNKKVKQNDFYNRNNNNNTVAKCFQAQQKPSIDQAILKFITVNHLPPNILENYAFKEMMAEFKKGGAERFISIAKNKRISERKQEIYRTYQRKSRKSQ
jgi:hypothetical protein